MTGKKYFLAILLTMHPAHVLEGLVSTIIRGAVKVGGAALVKIASKSSVIVWKPLAKKELKQTLSIVFFHTPTAINCSINY